MTQGDSRRQIKIKGNVDGVGNVTGDGSTSHVSIHHSLVTVVNTGADATRMEFNPNYTADVTTLFFRHPDAQLPELAHLIGHQAELLRLLQLYDFALREGRGSLVFVTGQPGYGTKALGRTLVDAVRKGNGRAAVTRFWPEEIEKRTRRDPRWKTAFEKYASSLENAPETLLKAEFAPFWPLAFQVWEKCGWGENEPLPTSPRDIPAYLRAFATPGKPLLLLLEDFEHAGPAWLELLRYLAPELAQGLPLVFIVTFHAEKLAEQIAAEARTTAEALALELAHKNLAELMHLGRVSRADVAEYIAPAQAEVAERLATLAGGLPILVQDLWDEWLRAQAVLKDKDGPWRLAAHNPWRTFGAARDYVRCMLEDLWPQADEAPWPAEKMLEMLTLAAQEGLVFTPAALALACGVEPEKLIYGLEYLLDDPDDPGLLQLDEPLELKLDAAHWQKRLERWRFSPPLGWYALQAEPPAAADLEKLAEALRKTYWPFVERCAASMARLYQQAGNAAQAAYCRSLTPKDDPLRALMNQAEMLLDGPQNDLACSRLWEISGNIYNAAISHINPRWAQGFYERVWSLAEQSGWAHFQADTLFYLGVVSYVLDKYGAARTYYERALKMDEELGRKAGIALNLSGLGSVYRILDEYGAAQAYFERALQMEEELGRKNGIADDLSNLGDVYRVLGEVGEAQAYFERALQMNKELDCKSGIARNLSNLGDVCHALGEYAAARAYFERALQMEEELGRKSGIARNLSKLGNVSHALGEYAAARAYFERSLKMEEELGHKAGIAVCWYDLGALARKSKNYEEARDYHQRALKVFQDDGRKYDVAANLEQLGDVEKAVGNTQEAEACYQSALEIFTEIGANRAEGVRKRLAELSADQSQEKNA